jgi:tetratricopeptide (TPR) repeat protein
VLLCAGAAYLYWDSQQKGAVIAEQQQERSEALAIAQKLLAASPANAAPGQEQSLIAALTAIEQQSRTGDAGAKQAYELLKAGKSAEALPLLVAAADEKKRRAANENKEAAKAYREAAAIAETSDPKTARALYIEAAQLDPDDVQGVFNAGWFQSEAGDLAAAETAFKRVQSLAKPGADERTLYWARLGLGDIQSARGNLAASLATYRDAGAIFERLAKSDPGNAGWQRDLSVSFNRVGDVLVAQGQLPEALKAFKDSLAIFERLAKSDPGNAGWQRDLAVSLGKVGGIQSQSGDRNGALGAFRQGREIIARLKAASPENATLPKDLAWFDAKIAALEEK